MTAENALIKHMGEAWCQVSRQQAQFMYVAASAGPCDHLHIYLQTTVMRLRSELNSSVASTLYTQRWPW
jgi:hypothetical protein